jgi:glycosyltransferase involved in cell wall biosynthesis
MSNPNPKFSRATPTGYISIVVPVYNEREVLPLFLAEIKSIAQKHQIEIELVFVDDGSTDASLAFLRKSLRFHSRIKVISLSRNFGKEAALSAGLENASGDAVIIMDADLQDPPEQIPNMVKAWKNGADVVAMKRNSRLSDSLFKRWSAHFFYRILGVTSQTDIPADVGDFRLLSRKALDALLSLPERNRYMKGLFAWIGMPTQVLLYDRPPRPAGLTKWSIADLFGLALEGITSFSTSPLRIATITGITAAAIGAGFGIWIVSKAIILGSIVSGYPSLVAIITFLGGIQLFSIGIVGEYVGKTYIESKQRPLYLIDSIIETNVADHDSLPTTTGNLISVIPKEKQHAR